MATNVTVKNTSRTPLRLGTTAIPRDGSAVSVDIDDRSVLRDMYRHIGRYTMVNDAGSSALSGITASSAEINILDGATLSTAELNILDGVTATASELSKLAGAGAVVASGTQQADIADVADTGGVDGVGSNAASLVDLQATNTALNAILDVLDAFGMTA